MTRRSNILPGFLLSFCILKVIADLDLSEISSDNGYSNYIDVGQRLSKTVRRALHEDVKDNIQTPIPFIEEHLAMTNTLRAKHGSPPLEIDYQLCLDAEGYAKDLAQQSRTANKITLKHSGKRNVGENLLGGQNIAKVTGAFCAEHWYAEIDKHNFRENVYTRETGHFTQLIWKATNSMGVAQVNLPSTGTDINITVVVARYIPQGNWAYRSSFAVNVLPPS